MAVQGWRRQPPGLWPQAGGVQWRQGQWRLPLWLVQLVQLNRQIAVDLLAGAGSGTNKQTPTPASWI